MAITPLNDNLNIVQALGDRPNALDGLSAAQLKAKFDEAPNLIKTYINTVLIAELLAVTDGDSGADSIGATAIPDLDGVTVQAVIESLRNKLKSITDGSSGADFIGASTISGLSGDTVQELLEALKTYIDSQDVVIGNNYVSKTELTNDRKLSATGNFTGTWNGLNQTASDPGIQAVVDRHTNQLAELSLNVKNYSAQGDGVTDDTVAIQTAQAAALAMGGAKLYFPPGRYMIKGTNYLEVTSGSVIWEGVPGESIIDFSNRSDYEHTGLIRITGSVAEDIPLTANFTANTDTVTVGSTATMEAYEVVMVASNNASAWPGDTTPVYPGQLSEIYSIDSSTAVTMAEKAYETYATTDTAIMRRYNWIETVHISGITFIGKGHPSSAPADGGDIGLVITIAKDVTIKDCSFINIDYTAVNLKTCYEGTVDNCDFYHQKHDTEVSPPVQYQMRVSDGSTRVTVKNSRGSNSRHFFNTGHSANAHGISRFITVMNCVATNTWHAGYSTHNSSEYVTFSNCTALNCRFGFNLRERNSFVIDCVAISCTISAYLSVRPQNVKIHNLKAYGGTSTSSAGVSMADADIDTGFITKNIEITNCTISGMNQCGIILQNTGASGLCKGTKIQGNEIFDITGTGNFAAIRVNGDFVGVVQNNMIYDVSNIGVRVENGATRVVVQNNHIDTTGNRGVQITTSDCVDCVVRDNLIANYTTASVTDSGTRTKITGNVEL